MVAEPRDGRAQIHQALAAARDFTNKFTKRNMSERSAVNLGPGHALEQTLTRFRGQVV